jgi:hypothetical protein
MTVYVDESIFPFRGTLYCHVWADSLAELHGAAAKAGLRREWFQEPPKASWHHYDCAPRIRAILVANGAIETDRIGASIWEIGRTFCGTFHPPTLKAKWNRLQRFIRWRAARPTRDLFADLTPEIHYPSIEKHWRFYEDQERQFIAWWTRAVDELERQDPTGQERMAALNLKPGCAWCDKEADPTTCGMIYCPFKKQTIR